MLTISPQRRILILLAGMIGGIVLVLAGYGGRDLRLAGVALHKYAALLVTWLIAGAATLPFAAQHFGLVTICGGGGESAGDSAYRSVDHAGRAGDVALTPAPDGALLARGRTPILVLGRHGQKLAVARHRAALKRVCRSGADLVLSFAAPRYACRVPVFTVTRLRDANFLPLFNTDESITVQPSPADSRRTGVAGDRVLPKREGSRK